MALSATKLICFVCFLSLFFFQNIHAREIQFFSKVPSSHGDNNNKGQQQQEPTSFAPAAETQKTATFNEQQEPSFIPDNQNGYGLYGQENNNNNHFPTTTTAISSADDVKYEPYTTPITSTRTGTFEPYTTTPATTTTTTTSEAVKYEPHTTPSYNNRYYNNNNNNNNGFETEQESFGDSGGFQGSGYKSKNVEKQGMSDTRFLENGRYYYDIESENNNNYHANMYQQQQQNPRGYQASGYKKSNNVEKQGMSDTRFLENGRYYYDVENENNYNPNQYQRQQSSRGYYNGNSNQYNNNYNSMEEGYQNEFDELP